MIRAIEVPEKGWHVVKLGAPVIAIAKAINALRKLQFKPGKTWKFSWEEGGAIIEYPPWTGDEATAVTFPWQPYLSPTATGTAAGRTIRIRLGQVNFSNGFLLPARRNIEIVVPPNCTTGYFIWLEATVDAAGAGTALDYDHGSALPPAVGIPVDGSPPPINRTLLFVITSTGDALELSVVEQLRTTSLSLLPTVIDQSATQTTRAMEWKPEATDITQGA